MRRYLFLAALLLLVLKVSAQSYTCGSVKEDVGNTAMMDAEQKYKLDKAGVKNALIIVNFTGTDAAGREKFKFDGGSSASIIKVSKEGEVWLFITSNSTSMDVKHNDYGNQHITFKALQANRTYKMEITVKGGVFTNDTDSNNKTTTDLKNKTFTVNGVSFEMVAVKGGTFTMGSDDSDAYSREKPTHRVTVSDFMIGKFEVTQKLWKAVMGSNPSRFKGDNLPVENVSWNDAQEFIRKLNQQTGQNFRLPIEAEWEYAARGGTNTSLYNGEDINIKGKNNSPNLDKLAWYGGNCGQNYTSSAGCDVSQGIDISGWSEKQYNDSKGGTHPVGLKHPNAYGLYDMLGNVCEWCQDWYGDYSSGSQTNPTGPSTGSYRVSRGGSWGSYARVCRVSNRNNGTPGYSDYNLGFRLAADK